MLVCQVWQCTDTAGDMPTVSSGSSSEPTGVLLLTREYSFDIAVVAQGEVQLCLVGAS